jgi:hypothetical protein
MRSANDHHLLVTAVRLRLKRYTIINNNARKKFNVLRSKDTKVAFKISLSNQFQPLQELINDSETDIETLGTQHETMARYNVKRFWGRRPNTKSASFSIPSRE